VKGAGVEGAGVKGANPRGAGSEQHAARWVRDMFGRVAHRYDLANHLLSFNLDRQWRERAVESVRDILERPDARVLDLCCGTADLTLALSQARGTPVIGSDFCHPMLTRAAEKFAARGMRAPLLEADALALPLADASLDVITCAFGFRNLANYHAGLTEFRRVLKSGGKAVILEFSQPPNPSFAALYDFYSQHVLPRLGGLVTGARDAYTYLPESVKRFPPAAQLERLMIEAGFREARFQLLSFGIVALHVATA
jgi:demethylmenaquinone methyltransferase/2-methoxy-6-polyprenyl-1,4-benzoquinol methylase